MRSPLKPYYRKKKTDYSWHRTFEENFGSVTPIFPLEKNIDSGLTNENQGFTTKCTAETVTDIITDEIKKVLSVDWQYAQTLRLADLPPNANGCDLKTAFSVPTAIGILYKTEEPIGTENKTQLYRNDWKNWPNFPFVEDRREGMYFFLYDSQLDWFDDVLNFINKNDRAVGVGTPWYAEYEMVHRDGIMPKGSIQTTWHAWKVCGWKNINGEAHLICKSWQGPNYADNGFAYFSREEFNRIMNIRGSVALVQGEADPEDIKTVQWGWLERLLGLLQELWSLKQP